MAACSAYLAPCTALMPCMRLRSMYCPCPWLPWRAMSAASAALLT
ncbi:Uncharacterised protein [Bordetella pertussis]|nr:Uncharacterised protein [Bordetella pertussis]